MTAKSCIFSSMGCFGYALIFFGVPFYLFVYSYIEMSEAEYWLIAGFISFVFLSLYSYIINMKKGIQRALLIGLCVAIFAPFSPFLLIHGDKPKEYTPYEACEQTLKSLRAAGGRYSVEHGQYTDDIEVLIPYYYYWRENTTDPETGESSFSREDIERLYEHCSEIYLWVNDNNHLVVTGRARDAASSTIVIGPSYNIP